MARVIQYNGSSNLTDPWAGTGNTFVPSTQYTVTDDQAHVLLGYPKLFSLVSDYGVDNTPAAIAAAAAAGMSRRFVAPSGDTTGATDTAAINAAISALQTSKGVIVLAAGATYYVDATYSATPSAGAILLQYNGVGIISDGTPRGSGVATIKNVNTSGKHCIHIGDPAEASADGAHLSYIPIEKLTIQGVSGSGDGVRIYNASVNARNIYSYQHGGYGFYVTKAWASRFDDLVLQQNGAGGFKSITGLNNVRIMNPIVLTHTGLRGFDIGGGSAGSNDFQIIGGDYEGNDVAIYLDTSTGTIKDAQILGGNFESNTSYGVQQAGTGNLTALKLFGGTFYGAGNGISLGIVFASTIISPALTNCNIALAADNGNAIILPRLEGSAAVTGVPVIANDANSGYPNGSFAFFASARYPARTKINGTWCNLRAMLHTDDTVSGTGGVTYNIDLTSVNQLKLSINSGTITGLTLTASGDTMANGEVFLLRIQNASAATGSVTLPSGWLRTSSAISIPANGTSTTLMFQRDGNGQFWEINRATQVG